MKQLLYIISILFLFSSCEDVIDIDLDSVEPQIVIEGTISNHVGPYFVKIIETTDYFNPTESITINNAIVTISDSEGNEETLTRTGPGIYETATIQGVIGRTYKLNVNIEGEEYEASSYMPDTTSIDFITYNKATLFQGEPEDIYVLASFNDTKDISNYYRLKLYIDSELTNEIHITNDEWQDGKNITYGMLIESALIDDVFVLDNIEIELLNIDEHVYEYYSTLNALIEDMFIFSSTPANPNSNISNGALGYFGAYSSTQESIIIR